MPLTVAGGRALLAGPESIPGEGAAMAVEGGGTPDTYWDEARVALGRVLWAMNDNPEVSPETLRALENYEAIPLPVREAL
jgi:hypothetical protein